MTLLTFTKKRDDKLNEIEDFCKRNKLSTELQAKIVHTANTALLIDTQCMIVDRLEQLVTVIEKLGANRVI